MLRTLLLCAAAAGLPLYGIDLVVTVSGVSSEKGEVGCALFKDAAGFPMEGSKAVAKWIKPKTGAVECRFTQLSAGSYAVAVSHDLNGNRKTDTNFVGMPKEDWGVSNNVRPKFRAPRFEEARFEIKDGEQARLEVRIAR